MPSLRPDSNACQQAVDALVAQREGKEWCLFVDRDGVLNRRIVGDYVRQWEDFEWLPKARSALVELREWAPHVVIVTNQQGVGKGLMSAADLNSIHRRMRADLPCEACIEDVQICPHLETANCDCRKPRPGLILDWLARHRQSTASLSVMVGDSTSDMELAENVRRVTGGCAAIRIGKESRSATATFGTLWAFAEAVKLARGLRK